MNMAHVSNNGSNMSGVEKKIVDQQNRVPKTATNIENKLSFTEDTDPQCRSKRNSIHLEHVCRICLHSADSNNMISLMTTTGKDVLANIYYTITSIEVGLFCFLIITYYL